MEKLRTIGLVMVVVFVLGIFGIYCGDANAAGISPAGSSWSQNFDLQGIHLSASAGGYEETAYANCWGHLQQGVDGRYYEYENSNTNFYTLKEDPSEFNFNAFWQFRIIGEENYVPNFNINASQDSRINAFGISFYSDSDIKNYTEWVLGDPEWYPVITDDIAFSLYFNLEPACMENINLSVNEWTWGENQVQNVLGVSFSGNGYIVPESATVALLGLGGLFLRRRK